MLDPMPPVAATPAVTEPTVVIVEDDVRLGDQLHTLLSREGFGCILVRDGHTAVDVILEQHPDLVLLDLGLPGRDGLSVCRAIRSDFAGLIVILTARGDELDEVLGLELGADDYVTKPVRPRALVARLHALRRRRAPRPQTRHTIGPLVVDPTRRTVTMAGTPVELTDAELDLLLVLVRRVGQVTDRDTLYRQTRGIAYDGLDRSIDLRVSRLRKKLGDHPPRLIKSVRGVGYLLAPP